MKSATCQRWSAFIAIVICCGNQRVMDAQATGAGPLYDVVVYGGTSGGVTAAIQAKRLGKSVVLIEPGKHLGGLSAGGLGATDIGNKQAIGGLSRDFYRRVAKHYADEAVWKQEKRASYLEHHKQANEREMWTFEPHVAEAIFIAWLKEFDVPVVMQERLDLKSGVKKLGARITTIVMESGKAFAGKMFIDASYEGDLLAKAGVSYHVGREANSLYGETLNGIEVAKSHSHQFIKQVDPYVKPGDPKSGLLPLVQAAPSGQDGEGDQRVQAYNFRMCTTDVPENRREWPKPAGYDVAMFELVLRNCEAGDERIPWNPVWMPNRKTDTNNNLAISTDYIGANYAYPDGDYATREQIIADHVRYQQGLMYTLANNPRVPEKIRQHFQKLGLAKDEFLDNDNWPHQLYVREARRMVSEYVMTQHNCQRQVTAEDSVGMGAYNMDSHNCQRYVDPNGFARNEGDVQVGVPPYPISYRAIRPKKTECENLLAPVCLSATHIAYGSIRMEPVFMVLGQSAATAAAFAIDDNVALQDLSYAKLNERLIADEQVLELVPAEKHAGSGKHIDPKTLPGLVLDNDNARLSGDWKSSSVNAGFVGADYLHDQNLGKGTATAAFVFAVKTAGKYNVRVAYTVNGNRAKNVPVTVRTGDRTTNFTLNEQQPTEGDGLFTLAEVDAPSGEVTITISNAGTDGYVIVDAVQLLPKK
jgi:hypothetical protein